MSLKPKLIILLLLIGLVPTVAVSSLAYVTLGNELMSRTISQVESLATKQHRKIDGILQKNREEVVKLANRYDLQSELSAYTTSDVTRVSEAINTILYNEKISNSQIHAIYLTDIEGKMIAAAAKDTDAEGATLRNTIGQTQTAPRGVLFVIREDPTDGINKLFITTTITVNQKDAAILSVVFRIDELDATVHDYTGLGATGETFIVAKNAKNREISLFPLRFDREAALNKDLTAPSLSVAKDIAYNDVVDYRGQQVIEAVKNVPATEWTLAIKIDQKEALGPINQLRDKLLFIVLGSLILIAVIALYFTRVFTAPIIALTEKTRSIMQGDFTRRIKVSSHDEVGTLAGMYNKMAEELAGLYTSLEQKVQERTRALNQKVQEVSDAKAKDDAILESIGEGMIVTDSAGNILLINEIAGSLLGLNMQNVIGHPLSEKVLYDDKEVPIPVQERPVEVALRIGRKVTQQAKTMSAEGQKKLSVEITATPVLQQGKVIGSIQIIRDITHEREVDRMKTEFISLASHQLRTPLSAIRWFSEMLISGDAGKLSPEQQEFAQNVYSSAERMIELVNSLLNISRIESGRIRIDPQPTDLNELVSGIVNDLKAKTEERQQTIIISIHKELPKINLDPRLIGQVYLNLLTNAIKYSPKGSEISVFVSRKGEDVVSQVTDSGYGIPKAEQVKVFQKFFRATNIVKVETDGTGLGMYLIKSIIESSGGKIWFESEEGKGTTFWFSLPMTGMKAKEGEVTIDM